MYLLIFYTIRDLWCYKTCMINKKQRFSWNRYSNEFAQMTVKPGRIGFCSH